MNKKIAEIINKYVKSLNYTFNLKEGLWGVLLVRIDRAALKSHLQVIDLPSHDRK